MKRLNIIRYLFPLVCVFIFGSVEAQTLSGLVTDAESGAALPYVSIYLEGTTFGTTSNDQGKYSLVLPKGNFTVICKSVGYEQAQQQITQGGVVNFKLSKKHNQIRKVVVKANSEDPAYRIIRKAIAKRPLYNKAIEKFEAHCYLKGKIKLDETPEGNGIFNMMSTMGGGEESSEEMKKEMEEQKGIIFLSESYSKIAYQRKPKQFKTKVLSSKVSGSQGAYGFSTPLFINFYDNNYSFSSQLSPRGFISPIASGAMRFYNYKLLETYFENGEWVNRIAVMPKRTLEPVYTGEIHIIDNSWRIHSLDLMATKAYELNVLDTIRIKQIHIPSGDGYVVKDQSFSLSFKLFGFGMRGHFVNVFTNYKNEIDPAFFDRYTLEYDSLALKQSDAQWEALRVIPLEDEERADYKKKDSINEVDKLKSDSLANKPFSYKPKDIVFKGVGYKFDQFTTLKTDALVGLQRFKYNTAEGLVYELPLRFNKKLNNDKQLYAAAWGRYGFSNQHLNGKAFARYSWGKSNKKELRLGVGQYVFQYNNQDPVDELLNAIHTIFYGRNFLKTYEAKFIKATYTNNFFNGFSIKAGMDYQDRMSLSNTTFYMLQAIKKEHAFTANYPTELTQVAMLPHRRLELLLQAKFQPGRRLIKYPDRVVSMSSRFPVFFATFHLARPILNTDASYARWQAGMSGDVDLNLYGQFAYRFHVGGFIDQATVFIPDYTHFNGNQFLLASPYLNSFQLAPYYANSNTESFYTSFHAEHHFNGLGTNKIPLFRKMKYYLVAASNGYYVNSDNNYIELAVGLENIGVKLFRFFRVDFVAGYQNFQDPVWGIRLGISSSMFSIGKRKDAEE